MDVDSMVFGKEDAWKVHCGNGDVVALRTHFSEHPKTDVNSIGGGSTALMIAASCNQLTIVEYLCQDCSANVNLGRPMGVSPRKESLDGATPVLVAAQAGHAVVVKYLMEHEKANVDLAMAGGVTPLTAAVTGGFVEVVNQLVNPQPPTPRCQVNKCEDDGWSALMMACLRGEPAIAKILVKAGGDPHLVAKDGTCLSNPVVAVRNTVTTA
eukprot:m.102812 g.102812  ORF g.102812 m.102812 type:complete len:211 (+) comp27440_c0_seq1:275-907(+)